MEVVNEETYCEGCEKNFCRPGSLQRHIKTAKYCMKARGEIVQPLHYCKSCHKSFNQLWCLKRHLEICKENKNELETVEYLKNQINQLKCIIEEKDSIIIEQKLKISYDSGKTEALEKIGHQKTINNKKIINKTVNNNKIIYISQKVLDLPILNIEPLTPELIEYHIKKNYDYYTFLGGYCDLLDFFRNLVRHKAPRESKDRDELNLACSDRSRNTFSKLSYDKEEQIKKWVKDGTGDAIIEVLDALIYHTLAFNNAFVNGQFFDDEEHIKMAAETYKGITERSSNDRKKLFKRLREDLKDFLVV